MLKRPRAGANRENHVRPGDAHAALVSRAAHRSVADPLHPAVRLYWSQRRLIDLESGVLRNTIVVNGRTWPYLEVEQRRYRFRFLNGCDSRFLILKLSRDGLPFWQIGADGRFLPAPARLDQLLMGPAERADVIVDFTNVPVGTEIVLLNRGPNEPFSGGDPDDDFDASDPETTGLVMQFRVVSARSSDVSTPPEALVLPQTPALPPATITRQVSLNEAESQTVLADGHPGQGHRKHQPANLKLSCDDPNAGPFGPTMAQLGTVTPAGEGNPRGWTDAITENPAPSDWSVGDPQLHSGRASDPHSRDRVRDRRTKTPWALSGRPRRGDGPQRQPMISLPRRDHARESDVRSCGHLRGIAISWSTRTTR